MSKFIMIMGMIFGLKVIVMAQSSASASVSATIQYFVGAEKTGDMDFGTFKVSAVPLAFDMGSSFSKYDLHSDGTIKVSEGRSPATFRISGHSWMYDITLQENPIVLTTKSGNTSMRASDFKLLTGNENMNSPGVSNIAIGAMLEMNLGASPGEYVSRTPYTVIINYN